MNRGDHVKAGQLLATLISADNGEWLVVAPDGKFDGSPAGWNQILWRFAGETFNVAAKYPDVVASLLAEIQAHRATVTPVKSQLAEVAKP